MRSVPLLFFVFLVLALVLVSFGTGLGSLPDSLPSALTVGENGLFQ